MIGQMRIELEETWKRQREDRREYKQMPDGTTRRVWMRQDGPGPVEIVTCEYGGEIRRTTREDYEAWRSAPRG